MRNKTLAIFVVLMLAVSVALGAVTGVFSSVKIGANTVIPAGTTGFTGTGNVVLSASPALTGVPTAPTAAPGTNTTQLATTAFVQAAAGSGAAVCSGSYPSDSCYRVGADGTKESWGHTTITFGGGSSPAASGSVTYPNTSGNAFTVNPAVNLTANDSAESTNGFALWGFSPSTSGISIQARCSTNITGSGCTAGLTSTITISWRAIGE